ncbi:MAG TPA: L-histidine N(alpha)-methyltransferase [Sphingobacteriaceae bacterium]
MNSFLTDVIHGLNSTPKQLHSKYLYGDQGDILFQKIMHSDQYYLTDCELEIFKSHGHEIADCVRKFNTGFDLIELGSGDAFKSTHLIRSLLDSDLNFTYYPIDISSQVINLLEKNLPHKLPGLQIKGLNGEYFHMLEKVAKESSRPKLILLLGANIGNMPPSSADHFCLELQKHMSPGDLILIGFDLVKDPWIIFNAYNDRRGITKDFNLNLLARINKELNANIDLDKFEHFENYDPETGACKSYLINLKRQEVNIGDHTICFADNECIFVEISQKYTTDQINAMAERSGFKPLTFLYDSKKWFADVIWQCS